MTDQDGTIVYGPLPPTPVGSGIVYSITLGNGYIVTSPEGFREPPAAPDSTARPIPPTRESAAAVAQPAQSS